MGIIIILEHRRNQNENKRINLISHANSILIAIQFNRYGTTCTRIVCHTSNVVLHSIKAFALLFDLTWMNFLLCEFLKGFIGLQFEYQDDFNFLQGIDDHVLKLIEFIID